MAPCIALLTGPNYRTWSKQMEILLRSHDHWDVVCPPTPLADADAEAGPDVALEDKRARLKKRHQGYHASYLIFGYCSEETLAMILYQETAAEQWAQLKTIYSKSLNWLLREFWTYEAPAGMGVAGIARKMDEMQEDIREISEKEGAGDMTRVAFVMAVKRACEGKWGEERWIDAEGSVWGSECSYANAVRVLVVYEDMVKADAKRAREARGGRGRSRKNVAGGR